MADDKSGPPNPQDPQKDPKQDHKKDGWSIWGALKGIGTAFNSVAAVIAGTAQGAVEHKVKPLLDQDHEKAINGCRDFDEVIRRDMSDFQALLKNASEDLGVGDSAPTEFQLREAMGALVTMRQTLHTNVRLYNVLYLRMLNAELANAQGVTPAKAGEEMSAGAPATPAPTSPPTPAAQGATSTASATQATTPAVGAALEPAGSERVVNLRTAITEATNKIPRDLPIIHETIVVPDMRPSVRRRMKLAIQAVCEESRVVVSQVNGAMGHVDDNHWVLLKGVIENIETLADELTDKVERIRTRYKISIH